MTSVNVTTQPVTLSITENGNHTVVAVPSTSVVELITEGPQGPPGPMGSADNLTFAQLVDVNVTNKVDQAVVYFNAGDAKFKADGLNTILSLTDGGNF